MGQMLGNLTNPAVVSPNGQSQFFSGAPQAGMAMAKQAAQTAQPSTADVGQNGPTFDNPQPQQPKMVRPSFMQAATSGPGGTPNAMSPALNKAGKLAVLLTSGLKGALAGRAASEQAVLQSGGHRSGGAGLGFMAGYSQPFQEAQQRQEAQLGQAGLQPIPLPGGVTVPAAIAPKFLSPYLGYQGKVDSAQIAGGSRERAAQTTAGGRVQAAEIGKRFIPVQGVGLYDTSSRSVIPGTEQGITITPEIADDYQLPEQFVGKPLTLQNLASVQRSSVFENTPQMTAQGPIIVNRRNAQATPVSGPGGQRYSPPALASPKEIADDANPGQTKFVSGGTAIAQGAAGVNSASVAVPKAAAKAEVPTKIGDQRVAFTTMIQHAQLLRNAAKALNNGDNQTLAGLKNRFKNEFGYSGPITAEAIADAYKGEVTNVINKGHITDTGSEKVAHTLNPRQQNYATMDSVLGAYESLARSKMNMLVQQKNSAVSQSQPKKPTSSGGGKVLVEGQDF